MGSIIKTLIPLLKAILPALFLIFLAYAPASAASQDKEGMDNAEDINKLESTEKGGMDMNSQEDTAPNPETSSNPPAGEDNLSSTIDASADNAGTTSDSEKSSPEQPIYPGVRNASIIRKTVDGPSLEIYYPVFDNQAVDAAIRLYAEKQAEEYEKDVSESLSGSEERPPAYEQWEVSGYFNLEYPNPNVVSVIFNIFSFSGGAHGNLVINCLNFNLKTGKSIDFADLFKDPEKALEMMSAFSAKKLTTELGDYADEDMILSGTTPDLNNFSNLSLVPDGLYIEFQPYQVGPWAAGPQRVEMTLKDLAAAGPEPDIWPGALNIPAPPPDKETESAYPSDPSGANDQD